MWHWRWTSRLPATSPISAASMACRQSPPASTCGDPVHAGRVGRMQLGAVVPVQPVGGDELVHAVPPNEKRRRSAADLQRIRSRVGGGFRSAPSQRPRRGRLPSRPRACARSAAEQVAHVLVQALGAHVRRLGDAGRLAAQAAEVIELGAAHLAAAHDLDLLHHRRIDREDALDALAVGDLAHGEALVAGRRPCGAITTPS